MRIRNFIGLGVVASLAVAACGGPAPSAGSANASVAASPVAVAPATLPTCLDVPCDEHPAGTYVMGADGLVPGLILTLPAGYVSNESSVGELELHQVSDPDAMRQLFMWRDVRAVEGIGGPTGPPTIVDGVDGSPESLVAWLQADPRFETSGPTAGPIGGDIAATWIDVRVSAAAVNEEPLTEDGGCDPTEVVCVGVLYDPVHWVMPGYAFGLMRKAIPDPSPGECCEMVTRFYFAEIGPVGGSATLVVALAVYDADPVRVLDDWQFEVQPILDSLVLPDEIVES